MKKDDVKVAVNEAEVLGELDVAMAKLDDAARKRALDWLRAKYVANAQLPEATGTLLPPWLSSTNGKLCSITGLGGTLTPLVFC